MGSKAEGEVSEEWISSSSGIKKKKRFQGEMETQRG